MLGWFRALMPREERFFELFTRHAQVTLAGAEALRALLGGTGDILRCCEEVNAREEEADAITPDVLTALRRSFITPLDRGDIKDLITSMDDASDDFFEVINAQINLVAAEVEPPHGLPARILHPKRLGVLDDGPGWREAA
jgi:uncharacterized protein